MLIAAFLIDTPRSAVEIATDLAASLATIVLLLCFLTTLVATFWPRRT
jgi:cbb3-type cytochrome oxidase subunit 3